MEHRAGKFIVLAAMGALMLTGPPAKGAERPALAFVVYVSDQADTDRSLLDEAQVQADRIFRDIGVRLVWRDVEEGVYNPGCDRFSVFITLLSPAMVQRLSFQGLSEKALGSAASAAGRASIHPARIRDFAARSRSHAGEVMGRVMAHEIGHLLLPAGHAHYGIMAAGMETDPTASARFTVPQTRAIRALLASKAAAPAGDANCGSPRAADGRD